MCVTILLLLTYLTRCTNPLNFLCVFCYFKSKSKDEKEQNQLNYSQIRDSVVVRLTFSNWRCTVRWSMCMKYSLTLPKCENILIKLIITVSILSQRVKMFGNIEYTHINDVVSFIQQSNSQVLRERNCLQEQKVNTKHRLASNF